MDEPRLWITDFEKYFPVIATELLGFKNKMSIPAIFFLKSRLCNFSDGVSLSTVVSLFSWECEAFLSDFLMMLSD